MGIFEEYNRKKKQQKLDFSYSYSETKLLDIYEVKGKYL